MKHLVTSSNTLKRHFAVCDYVIQSSDVLLVRHTYVRAHVRDAIRMMTRIFRDSVVICLIGQGF